MRDGLSVRFVARLRSRKWGWSCAVVCAMVVCLFAAATCAVPDSARAAHTPSTPQSRLFNVWLDLRLVGMFYPHTTAATLLSNLARVADELHQALPVISVGETRRDLLGSAAGAVMIVRSPPPNTLILLTRSDVYVWKLVDDAQGQLKVQRVTTF